MAGRLFDRGEAETLLRDKRVGPLDGFRSKMGRKFSAIVKLNDEGKQQFDFEESNGEAQKIDPEKHESLGECPICHKGKVYVLERAFVCENTLATPKTCSFRISKMILHRDIPKEQVEKLIAVGKTDLLPRFISKKGRPFSAHLKLENGKVGFEFAEKKPRAKKTAKPAASEAAAA
jgi:DNA topoisomerase-3